MRSRKARRSRRRDLRRRRSPGSARLARSLPASRPGRKKLKSRRKGPPKRSLLFEVLPERLELKTKRKLEHAGAAVQVSNRGYRETALAESEPRLARVDVTNGIPLIVAVEAILRGDCKVRMIQHIECVRPEPKADSFGCDRESLPKSEIGVGEI